MSIYKTHVVHYHSVVDCITELQLTKTHFGRPHFPTLFQKIRTDLFPPFQLDIENVEKEVGVFFCGKDLSFMLYHY